MSSVIALGQRYGLAIAVGALVLFAGVFLLNGRDELVEAIRLIGTVSPLWIVVLAGLQATVISIAAMTYRIMLARQGYRVGFLSLAEVHLRRILVGAVTPLGGPASLYVFVRSLRAHNVPDSDGLITASMRSVAGAVGFLVLLAPTLLLQSHSTTILTASTVLVLGLVVLVAGSTMLLRAAEIPPTLRQWLPGKALRFILTARENRISALDFTIPVISGLLSHVTSATMAYVGLYAVGYEPAIGTALIGYVIGKLFFMMAPVFQGIGIVEFGVALALQQAGVPPAIAVGGALLYRVGDLWIPLSWAFAIQLARAPLPAWLRRRRAGTVPAQRRRHRELPSRTWAAASQIFRMGQLVVSLAVAFVSGATVRLISGSGLALLS